MEIKSCFEINIAFERTGFDYATASLVGQSHVISLVEACTVREFVGALSKNPASHPANVDDQVVPSTYPNANELNDMMSSHLHLSKSVLPDRGIRSCAILSELSRC